MGRSGDLRALNDGLIRALIADPLFDVRNDGTVWTLKARNGRIGTAWRRAGRYDTHGYVQVSYSGKRLLAHRIVYQKHKGNLQADLVVDHKNEVRDDNRPDNLQLATARSNRVYMERRKGERT